MTKSKHQFFFVDEAGDPTFYNAKGEYIVGNEGCSRILLMGLIRTTQPALLREAVLNLKSSVTSDEYLQDIPSLKKTAVAFHAKDDAPEVREKMFKLIQKLDFKAEFVVARKIESVFQKKHKGKEHIFYDDLIIKLFKNKLHKTDNNTIYFAVRGSKTRQEPLEDAIQTAINTFEEKWGIKNNSDIHIYPQTPSGEPCLQIIDYMNWAIQRAFQKNEDRYYKFIQDKVSFLCDVYDFDKYPQNFYNRKNPFDLNKISPL